MDKKATFLQALKEKFSRFWAMVLDFADKEEELIGKDLIMAGFCSIPFVVIATPFLIFGFTQILMELVGMAAFIFLLVLFAGIAYDIVKLYAESAKRRIGYSLLVMFSSSAIMVLIWICTRITGLIVYGG